MVLIFIGKEFKYKSFLLNYIFNKYVFKKVYFFDNLDFKLEVLNNYKEIVIITNEKLYPTVSKIIATLNDDSLELKDEDLLPSKVLMYEKNSYLIENENSLINVIKYTNYLPEFLINKEFYKLHIFNYDIDSSELFVKNIFESFNIDYTIYENEGGWVEIVIDKINSVMFKQLKGFIPNIIMSENIFEYIQKQLILLDKKITFAESCTGGLIASYFTKVPGSSKIFDGSVVSYANDIKSKWLGVDKRVLEKFGAVSEETVQQMLLGILDISGSDYAIAVSGIAGPDGGSEYKPVGTVYIGVGSKEGNFLVERLTFSGSREEVQYKTLMNSIRLFINFAQLY